MSEGLELADLVAGLRAELARARLEGEGADLRFDVGPVELEVTVAVQDKGALNGGIKFWVVTAGASGEYSTTTTQRVKLTLTPEDGKDRSAPVQITGKSQPNER